MTKSRFAAVAFWSFAVCSAASLHAATITSAVSGNWNVTTTWSPQQIPTSADDVILQGGTGVSIPSGYAAVAKSLTLQGDIVSPVSLDLDQPSAGLTVTNNVSLTAPGSSVVDQLIVGQGQLNCASISIDSGLSGGISRIVVSTGSIISSGSLSFAGTPSNAEVKFSGNGTFYLTGNVGSGGTLVASTGTVIYNGSGSQTVGAYPYFNLRIDKSSGTASLAGAVTVGVNGTGGDLYVNAGTFADNGFQVTGNNTGAMQINSGAKVEIGSGAGATLLPAFNSYIFASDSTVSYKGQSPQTVASAPAYGNLTIDTGTSTATMSGGTTIAGNLTVSTGTLDLQFYTHNVGGSWINSATVTPGTSTVNFNSASAAQTISRGGSSFYNITFSGAGTKSIVASGLVVNHDLTINAGSNCDFGSLLHQIGGSWTNNGTFTGTGSTVDFNSAASTQNIGASNFYNLTFSNGGSKSATGALTVASNFVVNSGATFNAAGFTHSVAGNWTVSGTFSPGASTVNFNGVSTQAIGATTFNNVTFNNGGLKTFSGLIHVNKDLTVNAGASLNCGTATNTSAGNFTINGTITNISNGWTFNGSSPQTIAGTATVPFANITISNGTGVTLSASILVSGTLDLSSFKITTNANAVQINGGGSITRTTGFVIGFLKLKSVTGSQSFPVGTAGGYSPVTMVISGTTDMGVSAIAGNACCSFAGSNHLQHYWQIFPSSGVTADLTFTWPVTEVVGTESNYILASYAASAWTYFSGAVNSLTHVATVSGVTIPVSTVSWNVGEGASLAGSPTIATFTPTSGPVGTGVTINGTGLTGASNVSFNGTSASFAVLNDGQITTTVPAGATTGPVSVTTPGGSASGGTFTVASGPTIASFSPTAGSVGVTVVLTGSAFTGATLVSFNGTAATTYSVDNDNQITAILPAGATTGPISVTAPSGTGTSGSSFTVNAPGLIQSAASGNWTSPATWVGNIPPGTFDNVEILNGHTVTLTAPATIAGLAVDSGSVLNLGSNTLTDSASGSFFGAVNGSGPLIFSTNAGSSIDGNASIVPAVTFAGDRTFANTSTLSFNSGISISTGATVTNNGAVHVDNVNGITGTGTFMQGVFGVVTNGGPFLPAGTLNAAASPNSIDYNGAAQTVKATLYDSLTLSGSGTKDITGLTGIDNAFTLAGSVSATATASMSVGGDITFGAGTSFDLGSFTHFIGGNWTNNGGSVAPGTSTILFISSGSQTITRGTQAFNNIEFTGVGPKSAAGAGLLVNGNVVIDASSTFNGGALAHQVTGNWTNNGTFNPNTSSVEFQGGTSSIINGDFKTLIINKSGAATVSLSADADVSLTTQLTAGTLLTGTKSLITGSITGSGNITVGSGSIFLTGSDDTWTGTFVAGTGKVEVNGTGAQSLRGGTYNNVKINKFTGTATMTAPMTVNGQLWIAQGTLADNGFQMVANGGSSLQIDNNGTLKLGSVSTATSLPAFTTFTLAANGTVNYGAGSSSQQIDTTPSYGHLIVDAAGVAGITKSLTGATLVAQSIDVTTSGGGMTLDLAGKTATFAGNIGGTGAISFGASSGNLNVGGNFGNTGTFTAGSSTVTYNGSGAQAIRNVTYNNLTIANSGTATLAGATIVNGVMQVSPGGSFSAGTSLLRTFGSAANNGTFNAGSNTIDLRGDFSNNGTFVGTSGTVAFNGTAGQNWNGGIAATLNNVSVTNAVGVGFNGSVTANGIFTLNGANVTIAGGQQVAIGATGSVSRLNSSYFIGKLQMFAPSATATTFHLGTAAGYAPVNVTPTSSGNFTIASAAGAQPNVTGPNVLSRYWTIQTASTPSVDLTFQYNSADVTGAEALYTAGRYLGTWTRPTTVINTGTHTATVTGITAYNGDWTAGEPLSLSSSATCTASPAGIVSWWRAQGNAVDDAGTNNATLQGGAITAGGKVGQAFSLNGTTAYVSAPNSASLQPSSLTIEAWVFFNSSPTGPATFISKPFASSTNDSFALWYESGALRGGISDGGGFGTILTSAWTPTPGTWYHVAYSFDGGTESQVLYLNGAQVASGVAGKVPTYDNAPLFLGADLESGTPSLFLNGSIDEATLYNAVLTGTDIANIYGADTAGKCFTPVSPSITSFSPGGGVSGTSVTISGSGLIGTSSVSFNGTPANYTVNSSAQITATVPIGATTGPIGVSSAGGGAVSGSNFTVFSGTADLAISLSAPGSSIVNIPFNYTIGVNNIGPDPGSGVTVTSTLPASFTFNSVSTGAPWSCGFSAPTLTCSATALPTGIAPNITVSVTATSTGSFTESASIAATSTADGNATNDTASHATTITPASADLALTQSASPASTGTGGNITYTLVVTNNGPSSATGVTVTDVLPSNVTYSGATGATCSNSSGTITCTAGALASGNSVTININTIANAVGTATATGSATAAETDPNSADNANITASSAVTGSTIVVTTAADSGAGSLRQAIIEANAGTCTSPCSIQFAIGSGAQTINLSSGLAAIIAPVIVDGTTQPGYAGTPLIDIDLTSDPTLAPGLQLNGGNSTVKALRIEHAQNNAIVLGGATGNNTIQSCMLDSNAGDGVKVLTANNTIGGSTAALGNLISANGGSGIVLFGAAATGNTIRHNFIGTNANATASSSNGSDGIQLLDGASSNSIDLNVISGNSNSGMYLTSSTASQTKNNTITGNLIGTDGSGAAAIPNGTAGIYFGCTAPMNTVGGTTAGSRNVISGNPIGIQNIGCGSDANVIAGNYIGTAADGVTPLANGTGIALHSGAAQTIIGGTTTAAANVIANSSTAGVSIVSPSAGNAILHNSITANSTGISLDGLLLSTINDSGDGDTGANNLQNSPILGSANFNGSNLDIALTVDSSSVAATQSLVVEVFKADGSGQGKTYLGTQCFNGNTIGTTMTIVSPPVVLGDPIVATATSYATTCAAPTPTFSDGTSPFSASINITCAPPVSSITSPPSVCPNSTGNGASVPFTGGATYLWSITNGTITGGQGTSAIAFSANASGSVGLGVTVTFGCASTSSATVPITAATATITPSGSTNLCSGGSVDLTANSGTSYQWLKNGNPTGVTSQTLTATVSGSYTVIVTNGSCSATSAPVSVTVNPSPVTTITGPSAVCPNTTFTLDAGAGFTTYSWSNGASSRTITTQIPSTQTFSVTVTDANGCQATASHIVTTSAAVSATITAPNSANANSTGLVASVASGATSYNWTITNGTITSGQGTSSITFSIGSTSATLGVTVVTGSCTATGTKTVQIANLADLSIAVTASPNPVAPGGTLTYTLQVTNAGPTTATNATVTSSLPNGVTFVSASGAGWSCFGTVVVQCSAQSAPVGTASPIVIIVNAPASPGPITNSVTVASSTSDPHQSNNSASVTTNVGAANCGTTPPSLLSPANGATGVTSPVSLQWSAVTNATSYDVFTSIDGGAPSNAGSTASTSLFVNLPSGAITWSVVAHIPNCGDLVSAPSQFTINPGANCGSHGTPALIAPSQNASTASPVTFSWQPVPEAIGYHVFVSINGGTDQDFGATNGATTLTHDVASGNATWVVDALFNGCPSTRSARGAFNVPKADPCAGHATPSLIAPANNSTSSSSGIDFHWTAVSDASGYRVWIAIDGGAAEVAGETGGTTLHTTITSGVVDWFVEALFDGCASTSSAHFVFTVPHAQVCGTSTATPSSPANNSSTTSSIVTFTWNGAEGANGYELYVSLDNGSPVLIGTTPGVTSLTKEIGAGTLKWFVRALFNGCPPRDSQTFTFTYQPSAGCKDHVRPILSTPSEGSTAVTSPVSFEWSDTSASGYKLFINGELRDSVTQPRRNGIQLANGAYEWYVEASFNGCTSLRSTTGHFSVIAKGEDCKTPSRPVILAPGEVSTGVPYKVRWLPAPGADAYVVQEANNAAFNGATTFPATIDNKLTFTHPSAGTFFYRVRGINDCATEPGPYSAIIGVVILPQNSNDGAASPDAPVAITYTIPLDAALAGQTFSATPTEPWLTVTPPSGTVPASGLSLLVTANTAGLPLGTSLGGVTITTSTPTSGRTSSNGNTTSTTTLTVNVVQPVSPNSKSSPPPDALIIPAVAHADGFNSHFQSDIRLTNTSPQPMKYQLTFTPSGEDGLPNGKQTQIDVDPGRTVALDDILKTWFASGSTDGSTGTLEIRPLTSTSAKVTSNAISGLANLVTFASSRTFNATTNGTFGQYIPAIPFANFIGKSAGTITLQQIAQSAKYRTNLGIVEGSGQSVSLLVSIFGSNGQKIKEFPVDLKGGQHTQLNSFLTTQGLSLEDARVEVKVASGSGRVTAYASVLDNETSDPLLVTPTLVNGSGSAKYVLAGVADLNAWHSDVRIFNASNTKTDAALKFVSQTGAVLTQTITLGPNEVKQLDNLLQSTFGVTNDGGALHISTASPSNLIATARTFNQTTSGTYGQFISAVTPNDAAALGTRPLQLLQIEESDRYRTNVGLAEVNGQPAKVQVTVVPPDSKVSAVVELDLGANEFRQLNQILKQVGMENTYNARVSVQVIGGAGRITAYASVIDAETQDPTLIQAQ